MDFPDTVKQTVELLEIDDLHFKRQHTFIRVGLCSAVRLGDIDIHIGHYFEHVLKDTDAVIGRHMNIDQTRGNRASADRRIPVAGDEAV